MDHDGMRRRSFVAGLAALACGPAVSGMQANEVPLQEEGIALASRFLEAIDAGRDDVAWRMVSERLRARAEPAAFQQSLRQLRAQLGGRGFGRTLVGTSGKDPSVARREPNVTGRAQWSVRFRSKYPVGAIFEDVHLEFDARREWAVAGWFFSPAPF